MSEATVSMFPVGNGDMTLIRLNDAKQTSILIDLNILSSADDPDDEAFDVAAELRKRLKKDKDGRPYVDVLLLSHPDKDHCTGLQNHFHLGPVADYVTDPPEGEDKKIIVHELWSSPIVFTRASKNHPLCPDAKAFNTEAKRRIKVFRAAKGKTIGAGDLIKLIGDNEDGDTDGLKAISVQYGDTFSTINTEQNSHINIHVLGPVSKQEIEEDEESLGKNHSSVILRMSISADDKTPNACYYLTGGDAEVVIWEKIWEDYKNKKDYLQYDLLLSPHHCSWHVLSHDSWSQSEDPQVSKAARSALAQAKGGAFIISSSNPISDETSDPPCEGAKKEYLAILSEKKGSEFLCTGEYPSEKKQEPLEFVITSSGPQKKEKGKASFAVAGIASASEPHPHG